MDSNTELQYWISFTRIPGIGRARVIQLKDHFGVLSHAWNASSGELIKAGLDARTASSVVNWRSRITPEKELEALKRFNIRAIACDSPLYPPRLKEIYDYPPVLYVRGEMLKQDECCISVVGTRNCTLYGRQVTEEIIAELSRNNITIVSGLARGIDAIAHKTAIANGGRTLAVFGSGLDIVYPAENAELARSILEHGALVSEYPPGTKPRAAHFPSRNRIMSGLSLGVLAIEAGERSGALITAEQALLQNREVFAVPGSIFSESSRGTNNLIQQGAKLVRNHIDILEELNIAVLAQQLEMKELIPAEETETELMRFISKDPVHIDELCRKSGLPMQIISGNLTTMELKGLITHVGSMHYIISKEIKHRDKIRVK